MLIKSTMSSIKTTNAKLFAVIFCLLFAYLHSNPMNGNSIRGVEQWINMTNSMFYGNKDFLFSYGPLYWLTGGTVTQYSELTYWLSLTFMSLVAATFWFLLIKLTKSIHAWCAFIIVFFLYLNNLMFPSVFLLWPFLLVVLFENHKGVKRQGMALPYSLKIIIFLGLVTGAFFYVRFLYGMVAAATFGSYFLYKSIQYKKPGVIFYFVIALFLAYVAVGLAIFHDLVSMKDYITINSQLNFGNAVDMTYDNVLPIGVYIAFIIIFFAMNLFLISHYPALILTFNGLMIIFIKLGFGRADHYLNYFIIPISVIAMITCFNSRKRWFGVFVTVLGSLVFISFVPVVAGFSIAKPFYKHEDFSKSPEQRIAEKYKNYLLPESILAIIGKASVDVYPYNNEFVFANHLNYKNRPLFQNYMTLTPILDKMNQHYFESNNRPEFVIWHAGQNCFNETCNSFEGFDGKYALNEDPLTTNAIMLNYHVVQHFIDKNNKPVMLLQANKGLVHYQPNISFSGNEKFDRWIDVPNSVHGIVKIIPRFKLTNYAKMKNLMFRGDVLYVHYLLYSGEEKKFRLNILNAGSGVLASPLLNSFPYVGDKVKKIKFTATSSNYFYPEFKYSWENLSLENMDIHSSYPGEIISSPDYEGERTSASCEGYLESVKFSAQNNQRQVSIVGWSKVPLAEDTAPDDIFVHNVDEKGKEYFVRTRIVAREDVASHFKNNKLRLTGFEVQYELPEVTGENALGLAVLQGHKFYTCKNLSYRYR